MQVTCCFPKYISKFFIWNILYPSSPSLQSLSLLSTERSGREKMEFTEWIPQNHTTNDKDYNWKWVCIFISYIFISYSFSKSISTYHVAFLHIMIYAKLVARSKREEREFRSVLIYCRVVCLAWLKIHSILFYPHEPGKQCDREEVANMSQPDIQNQRTQYLIKYLLFYSETACRVQPLTKICMGTSSPTCKFLFS